MATTFGYHPQPADLLALLQTIRFARLVVVGGRVRDVVDHVGSIRTAAEVALPRGLYWFAGLDEPLALVVNAGATSDGMAVAVADLTDDEPLRDAYDWAEQLWDDGQPVPMPAFAVGEDVVTRVGGRDSQVRERAFNAGSWLYKIRLDGTDQRVAESDLEAAPEGSEPADWVQARPSTVERFGATLTRGKLAASLTDTVFSFRATRTVFRPYQFKPVLRLLNTGATRILVADEVGLGKTIEAGLIWTELEARHAAARVLIVAPSSLVGKWQAEMAERFDFAVTELDNPGLARFLEQHRANRLPKRFAHVTSLERLRAWDGLDELADLPPQFDLIIVDEAHAMRNPGTRSHALGEQLGDWADARVFLTATPVNLGNRDLFSMLELLAPEDFDDPEVLNLRLEPNAVLHQLERTLLDRTVSGADRLAVLDRLKTMTFGAALMSRPDFPALRDVLARDELTPADVVEVRRHLAEFNALSTVITRTRKAEIDEDKALREPQMVEVVWTAAEHEFYDQYVQWCVRRADHAGQPLHFCMQMPLRLASACLPAARDAVLGSAAQWVPADEDDPLAEPTPVVPIPPHAELVAAARALSDDFKFDRLLRLVQDLVEQGRRALLFTFSRPTLAYLQRRLSPYARVAVLHGGVPRDERRRVMAAFRAGEFDILLANRVASEGLDFEFCSVVVNYDLPWNPMEVEQRIGRIDRIGQPEQKILVVNFYNEQTIDEKILKRVLERIGVFEQAIGALEPIIQDGLPAVLEAVCDFSLSDAQRQAKENQFLAAIEGKRAEAERLADATSDLLVSNDVDVSGLERDLLRGGRYVGQRELAHLLQDWAETARGAVRIDDSRVVLRGNATMADQVHDVVRRGHRMQNEVTDLEHLLRDERDLSLVLDQEDARTGGGSLLTATHPLVLAAVAVPGHRQARFANVCVHDATAPSGRYAVVLALVSGEGDRGSRELWGAATDLDGQEAPSTVPDALLAALARGELRATAFDLDWTDELVDPIELATDQLQGRFAVEQNRRRMQADALVEARRVSLSEQRQRRLAVIDRRLETARSRGRRSLHLFEAQRRRTLERHEAALRSLHRSGPALMTLTHLAACYLEIV
ncbi:helicase-related protein [Pseudonocardia lacus]|uniref:DEAD/DEAH box helicase n=1 Tax=Pseudonocardia lacus TaxID=2835865 RepID=UPI001BDD9D6B|nr:helicase-related protein [Pseudonocardia lacus]